jgi:hypothetical protein
MRPAVESVFELTADRPDALRIELVRRHISAQNLPATAGVGIDRSEDGH